MARKRAVPVEPPETHVVHEIPRSSASLTIKQQHMRQIAPLTQNQTRFFNMWDGGSYFITLSGTAGSGKSFICLYKSLLDVLDRDTPYDKVVIVRSAVQTRDIGFTPGSLDEKSALYSIPYEQICASIFGRPDAYKRLVEQKHVEFVLTSFLRGTSFDRSIVIFDEAQNASFSELNTVITRIGKDSKVVVIGDTRQDDLTAKRKETSGLSHYLSIANRIKGHEEIRFTIDDIVRSGLVRDWLIAVEQVEKEQNHVNN
jgi:predicted ribonuclease YlaK